MLAGAGTYTVEVKQTDINTGFAAKTFIVVEISEPKIWDVPPAEEEKPIEEEKKPIEEPPKEEEVGAQKNAFNITKYILKETIPEPKILTYCG